MWWKLAVIITGVIPLIRPLHIENVLLIWNFLSVLGPAVLAVPSSSHVVCSRIRQQIQPCACWNENGRNAQIPEINLMPIVFHVAFGMLEGYLIFI